jgi:hypothetical protein
MAPRQPYPERDTAYPERAPNPYAGEDGSTGNTNGELVQPKDSPLVHRQPPDEEPGQT